MMEVIALTYSKTNHTYNLVNSYKQVGVSGAKGEIACGYIEDDVWYPTRHLLQMYTLNETGSAVDLHIVIPNDVVMTALVQVIGDDIVAVTPIAHADPSHQVFRTAYHHMQGEQS